MKRTIVVFAAAAVALVLGAGPAALQSVDPAGDKAAEELLTNAEIKAAEQLGGSAALTKPFKLTLEKDGTQSFGLWKDIDKTEQGRPDRWRYEIAAYKIDRLIGLDMVPVTIERRYREVRGSLQLWVANKMSLNTKNEKKVPVPPRYVLAWNRATYLQRAFDNLIANEDRHGNNILIRDDWRIYLIDHSRSFRTSKKFTDALIYTEKHREGPKPMKELPRALVEKIKGLTAESVRAAVGEYLDEAEIEALLKRRDLILAEVDRLIKLNGEEAVLY
ncbi:MAG: hypothetical protein NTZ26_00765 [Candidatus Aminicenantes bacterium]|nr:hypothetical protein [Candidatus Aminicenantes bacterium]